ncbi:hypothetical protein PybrP1_001261 [[Pythium] brassicae (nom. inval.)]|nr:hypothetical protein PybrP1_001261 [[Pythium] brassicae (nom. inval.)]
MAEAPLPMIPAILCYIQYTVLIAFGHLRDLFGRLTGISRYKRSLKPGFAPLLVSFESFYTKRIYHRLQDAFHRPIASAPGAHVDVIERYSLDGNKTLINKPTVRRCINLGSYNYLGFADDWMSTCSQTVLPVVEEFGTATTVPAMEFGTTSVHRELEKTVAEFLGKPAAIVYNMGYGTNASTIPALMGEGSLILSDTFNHKSIVNGSRASGATVCLFRHKDMVHLEQMLRQKIAEGQPRTGRPWRKILIMIEGIYSMEGEIVPLRKVVELKKKYKAFLYMDEAHSIGALGKTGHGVCEYSGVDPSEVDILMGTFSKSYAGMGGYIASSQEVIDWVRATSLGTNYAAPLSPVVAQQVLTAFNIIMGRDGTDLGRKKLDALRDNSNYLRAKLNEMGVITLGDTDSTIVPMLLLHLSKVLEFSRLCLERNLAVVTVGFPAVPMLLGRVRFCVSSAHTRQDLDEALVVVKEVAEICGVRFNKGKPEASLQSIEPAKKV